MRKVVSIVASAATLCCLLALVGLARRPAGTPPPLQQATFAAGCFWGVEAAFRKIEGVTSTTVGYTGGRTDRPTYRDLSLGGTGHAEAVLVTYDPKRVSYAELLDAFWSCHDPTRDFEDGPHRSVIFFHDPEQASLAHRSLDEVERSASFKGHVVTQVLPAAPFFPAEDYHQQYFENHGGVSDTCHFGVAAVHTKLAVEAAAARRGGIVGPKGLPTRFGYATREENPAH